MDDRRTVADVILAVAPEMRELVRLRDQVVKLRFETHPPTLDLATLIEGLPITVRQMDDGTWASTIATPTAGNTGTMGQATDIAAFRAAVEHVCRLLGEAWSREAEEDDE